MKHILAPVVIAVSLLCTGTLATSATAANPHPVLVQGLPSFSVLVKRVGPSVVNIRTMVNPTIKAKAEPKAEPKEAPKDTDPALGFINPPKSATSKGAPKLVPGGTGSGFILTSDGIIMTNAHVVRDSVALIVTLADGQEYAGTILGSDTISDVAIVKIEIKGALPVMLGNAESLDVGEWVMAIGSPFGFENTVTAGIVSSTHRDTGEFFTFIQTDVPINPGNSGGPLINMRGEVVGINSQIYTGTGSFAGISFSIPIGEAIGIAEHLVKWGVVNRGRIGITIDSVDDELAASLHLAKNQGALIRDVQAGGAAAAAGLVAGDVVIKFGDIKINRSTDLPRTVGATEPGTVTKITVLRKGGYIVTLPVTVAGPVQAVPFEIIRSGRPVPGLGLSNFK
jgi:serine protease Do